MKSGIIRCLMTGLILVPLLFSGCRQSSLVTIEGKISDFRRRDSVFVTLTQSFENVTSPPDSFSIDHKGNYVLQLKIRRNAPPITFVKNNLVHARLKFYNLDEFSPVVLDEISGKIFKFVKESDSTARAKIDL